MFKADFFIQNRKKLYEQLPKGGVVALTAHTALQESEDQAYAFRQESNFWYLTGIEAADWWLLADIGTGEEWLIAPQLKHFQEIFDGSLSPTHAVKQSGIQQVLDKKTGQKLLKTLIAKASSLHTLLPQPRKIASTYTNPAQRDFVRRLKGELLLQDIRLLLARQRAIKQPLEIAAIEQAIAITKEGLSAAIQQLPQLTHEYQAEAIIGYEFRKRGFNHAFQPIVANGKNACTLHYDKALSPLSKQQLLIFDVGAKVHGYAADIARTVAVGTPTARQQAVFAAVQRAQQHIIALLKPGVAVKDYMKTVQAVMQHELVLLGLMKKSDRLEQIYTWMPHAIGHGLGIDVHDSLGRPEHFIENMVLTVEPGIYIPDEAIGVRIEDNILITKNGPKILSQQIPIGLL